MKGYWVNEIFYSLQAEGVRSGTANVFVRFKGCNLECRKEKGEKSIGGFDCDTEFESGVKMTGHDLIDACEALVVKEAKSNHVQLNVIFTGGEPAIQLDKELVSMFKDGGWYTSIETNGSMDVSDLGIDWITVSPKVAEHAVRQVTADEVKYVRGHGQGIPKPACKAKHKVVSPAFDGMRLDETALHWCIKLVKEYPDWQLSVQDHKLWRVR